MKFKINSMISKPGIGATENEDCVGSSKNACWVIDGATKITEPGTNNLNEVIWFVNQVNSHLEMNIHDEDVPLSSLLSEIISTIIVNYKNKFNTETVEEEMISASILIVRYINQSLEFFSLGDCSSYIQTQEHELILQNQVIKRLETERIEKIFLKKQDYSSLSFSEFRKNVIVPELKKIKRENKDNQLFSVLKLNPKSALRAFTCNIPVNSSARVLLTTDGFSRMIDYYRIFKDFQEFLAFLDENSVEDLYQLLRETEKNDLEVDQYPRLKVSDDASLILATIS